MNAEEYYNKIRRQLGTQALLSYQIDGCRLYGKDAICKMLEDYHQAKLKELLPSDEDIFEESINHTTLSVANNAFDNGAKWLKNKLKQDK